MLRVLIVHNEYQKRGGEEAVVEAEARLLSQNGAEVIRYQRSNDELRQNGNFAPLGAAFAGAWSIQSYRAIRKILKGERPDIVHFHNTFPLVSPSAYYACAREGVPVVQTLHNYRLLCPASSLLRNGNICEDCLGKAIPWPGVLHACYRSSRCATAASAAMLSIHRAMGTWRDKVNLYIVLSEFARNKFIEGGLPAERIVVKPNFAHGSPSAKVQPGDFVLYVGRLSPEKGLQLLPVAWQSLQTKIPLRIAGDGPLFDSLKTDLANSDRGLIRLLGNCSSEEVSKLMAGARFQVVPSVCYEGFPLVVVEAFSFGLPVITSRLGSLAEIVEDGVTGLHFESGNAADLAAKVEWAWSHPEEMAKMGQAARAKYQIDYTPAKNYRLLMDIYRRAVALQAKQSTALLVDLKVSDN